MDKISMIIRLGNHHGMVLAVREDSKMIALDIESLLKSYHYPGSLEACVKQFIDAGNEEDWQTAYELFHFLEHGQ